MSGGSGRRAPGETASVAALPRPATSPAAPAVFLHSSWRTASTWFWLKFRQRPETLCYYEPFHEALGRVTRDKAAQFGPASWNSGHPASAPYLLEFLPLIRRAGGARLFAPEMTYEWFLPEGGLAGRLRAQERRYLELLLRHARRQGRVAVFGFTRSLGRLVALKRHFAGVHIFLYRNLWTHWASYVAQKHAGNGYFVETVLRVMLNAEDRFFAATLARPLVRAIERGRLPPDGGGDLAAALAQALSEGELFGLFMAMHLYLYLGARSSADLSVDATRLARDRDYRAEIAERVSAATGLPIAFADAADTPQAHWPAPDGIDWQQIRDDLAFAAQLLAPLFDGCALRRIGRELIEDAIAEMRTGERYLARARGEIARLQGERERIAAERDALAAELARTREALARAGAEADQREPDDRRTRRPAGAITAVRGSGGPRRSRR